MVKNLTRKAIKGSFIKLLNEHPLSKITIKDIVEDCGVSRNTFYYHYQDIFELLEDIFEEEIAKVIEKNQKKEHWQEGMIEAAKFVLDNKKACYHVYHSISKEQLERYLLKITDNLMTQYLQEQSKGLNISNEDMHYITTFYKYAIAGILFSWLENDMQEEPEYAIQKISEIFAGSSRRVLENVNQK